VIIVWVGFVWISNLALGMDLFEASSYGQLVRMLLFIQLSILELLKNLIKVIRLDLVVLLDCV
jgi:hypothetical protein